MKLKLLVIIKKLSGIQIVQRYRELQLYSRSRSLTGSCFRGNSCISDFGIGDGNSPHRQDGL